MSFDTGCSHSEAQVGTQKQESSKSTLLELPCKDIAVRGPAPFLTLLFAPGPIDEPFIYLLWAECCRVPPTSRPICPGQGAVGHLLRYQSREHCGEVVLVCIAEVLWSAVISEEGIVPLVRDDDLGNLPSDCKPLAPFAPPIQRHDREEVAVPPALVGTTGV